MIGAERVNVSMVTDMETSIMHKLQNYILEQSQLLVSVTKISAELDW